MDSEGWRHRLESRPLLADHPIALRVTLLLWILGGMLFVALRVPAFRSAIQVVDDGVYRLAVNLEFAPAVGVATALDFLGGSWVTFPVMVAVGAYLVWRKRWEGLLYWVLSMMLSQVMIGPIKALYARPRPPHPTGRNNELLVSIGSRGCGSRYRSCSGHCARPRRTEKEEPGDDRCSFRGDHGPLQGLSPCTLAIRCRCGRSAGSSCCDRGRRDDALRRSTRG